MSQITSGKSSRQSRNWPRNFPKYQVSAIIGASRPEQIADNVKAAGVKLRPRRWNVSIGRWVRWWFGSDCVADFGWSLKAIKTLVINMPPLAKNAKDGAPGEHRGQKALSHAEIAAKSLSANAVSAGAMLMDAQAHQLLVDIQSRLSR